MQFCRYPGVAPFQRNQENIFFGRERDIDKLQKLIILRKQILLYAKSGVGKTSLLNAGILPRFENNFIIINVRFFAFTDKKSLSPLERLFDILKHKLAHNTFNLLDDLTKNKNIKPSLWYYFKHFQLSYPEKAKFILIFDQFEELFSYPESQIEEFKEQLSELLNADVPDDIMQLIVDDLDDNDIDNLHEPLKLKTIFSIRSDRLSLLNHLSDKIPNIQQTYYELEPLTVHNAYEAITRPAKDKKTYFKSPNFKFEKEAINTIINALTITDTGKQNIEGTQLQIICQKIEDVAKETNKEIILKEDLPNFKDIFLSFYNDAVLSTSKNEHLKVFKFIEDHLIRNEQRIRLDSIICQDYISKISLDILVDSHLLRAEANNTGRFDYELSHDTLIEPILISRNKRLKKEKYEKIIAEEKERLEELKKIRKEKQRQRKIILMISIFSLVSFSLFIWGFHQKTISEKAHQKAQKIIDAFHFYNGKLALAYKKGKYGFIDKEGNVRINYKYTEAMPFNVETGFAKVRKHNAKYLFLIDTLSNEYQLAEYIEAFSKNTQAIYFQKKRLLQLPDTMFTLKNLKIISVRGNRILKLSPQIGQLINLTHLDLFSNCLIYLPKEIGRLKNLIILNIANNFLKKLPQEIKFFKKLKSLNLQNNFLETLPIEIQNIINLQNLVLANNKLNAIPKEIKTLIKLKNLDLYNNNLKVLPKEIGKLKNITTLDLGENQLISLPNEIINLKKLENLDLYDNQLEVLPNGFEKLINLKFLDISENNFTKKEQKRIKKCLPNCEIIF